MKKITKYITYSGLLTTFLMKYRNNTLTNKKKMYQKRSY
jgi:hypothetical protein